MTKDQTPSPVVTREEVIRWAREAGVYGPFMGEDEDLERFFRAAYAAGAAAEREACMQAVTGIQQDENNPEACVQAIRARSST